MFVMSLLLACQDYNLQGPAQHSGKYNPPDLASEQRVDRITQVTIPSVDVLWVDNSCSMEEEQAALRSNFGDFMRYFTDSGLDYHVGVVSTDMDNRRQSGILVQDSDRGSRYIDTSYSSADAVASFSDRASLGTGGSSDERGKDAAFAAIVTQASTNNAGFYREDAALSIVVISDEIDYSRMSVDEFVNWMLGLKTSEGMVSFSSIVGPAPRGCATAERGSGYLEVTEQVGGIDWSICTDDWSGMLTELGLQAAGLKREFFLSLVPVEETIVVTVEPDDGGSAIEFSATDWTYSRARNSVTFASYVPDPLSVVNITYDVLASSQAPAVEEGAEDSGANEE
jgi:hypothetical protein